MKKQQGTWLVGISAGPDSMALFFKCLEAGMSIAAAHVNYHHRPEADEEEAYVREVCRKNGVHLFVRNEAFENTGNFEADARSWRYHFFRDITAEYGYEGVLIAHQEDDLLETYLMQSEKKITPQTYGLAEENRFYGMRVVRPLLNETKKDLEQYCRERGIRYYIDATNLSREYSRNRLRLDVVEKMNRAERDEMRAEIRAKNQSLSALREEAEKYIEHGCCSLERYRLLEGNVRLTVLRKLVEPEQVYGNAVSSGFLKETDDVLMRFQDFEIPVHNRELVCTDGMIHLIAKPEAYDFVYRNSDELMCVSEACFSVEKGSMGVCAVTLEEEDFPVHIRSWKPGDRILLRFGTKKVQRFFIDRHIPAWQRKVWPVVENAKGEIVLVPGLGCDVNHYSVNPTHSVLQCFNSKERKIVC